MNNPTPTENPATLSAKTAQTLTSPLRCLIGSLIAGGLAYGLYLLTSAIAQSFAAKPISSTNPTVVNIGIAVRTLVVGVSTLATFVCGLVAFGLFALAIQILIQKLIKRLNTPSNT